MKTQWKGQNAKGETFWFTVEYTFSPNREDAVTIENPIEAMCVSMLFIFNAIGRKPERTTSGEEILNTTIEKIELE